MTYAEFKEKFLPELLNIKSFNGKIKYANQYLQRIGSGTGRIVYDIDGEKVLKLAKNTKGVGQNEAETGAGYYRENHGTVAIVFDSADDNSWLIAEKAKKVNEARIKQLTGIPSLNDLYEFLKNYEQTAKGADKIFSQSPELEDFFWNHNEFAYGLADFVANYNQNAGDMGRPSSYGEVMHNGQPTIVLTDYGLNDEVYDTYYSGKKQPYRMHELYNFADGNDDILGDMPPQDGIDTRQAMWGLMPYGVGDGPGVINEEFLSFVENTDKYPQGMALPSTPYILDEFHDIVNNLKEVLEHVPKKKKFYSNLLELQDYLIRGKFYDREPLEEETVEINETSPKVDAMQLPREYSDTLAEAISQKLNLGSPKYLGGGGYGYAYEVNNNRVLKITTDACEVDAGLKINRAKPKTLAMVYNVYKVTDTVQNKAVYALIEDNIVDKPHQEFERYTEIINSLGEDLYGRLLRILIKGKPKKEDTEFFGKTFNDFPELAKLILTANPDANINVADREKAYRFMLGLYDIKRELQTLMIRSDDYMTLSNLGYKNGILTYYDIGGCMGVVMPDLPPENRITLPESEEVLNEDVNGFPRAIADKVATTVAQKFNYGQPKYVGYGTFGYAYDIGNNMILKVTKDQSEANENLELIGKPLKRIAQPYKVFSIKSNTIGDTVEKELYVIILEKLKTDNTKFIAMVERMKFAFEKIMGANYADVIDHYVNGPQPGDDVDEELVQKYLSRNPQDAEFFNSILEIGKEVNQYGIQSMDYVQPTNLGYKPDGTLGFFDVGFGNYFFKSNNMPEPVQVDEDGSALYATDNSFGQDNFPVHNNTDTSPSIQNDLNANSEVNEDLEYNHVVGDATQDEFQITERVQSFQPGSKTVDVKEKCRLGGNGDGTSTACNQGDIGNLTFGSIKESVDVNIPNNLSGYDSLKITDDGQVVGEVGIMDRGVQGQNHYIAIDKIFINKEFRGKGYANDAMKLIFDYADRNKLIVTLTPDSMWGASKSKLTAWYKSLGFKMNKGRNKDFQTMQLMYRLPNSTINEVATNSGEKYYRAVEKYMGETIEFEPEGYYEAIDDDGNPIYKYDTFWVSETPEIAASKSVGGALMGLYSMFMQHGKNPGVFYVYEINEKPDADISHWEIGDFTYLKEVRFRRAVQGHYVGKVDITDDFKKRMNAFYEINGLEAYDEPDEETSQTFQDTDYEQYLDKMKNTIHEEEFPTSEPQIEKDNVTHELDKNLVRTYDDGIDVNPVYAVNGDEVRDSGFIEWVEGGNHWVDADLPKSEQKYAKHIPADELWVDDVHLSKPNDFEAILLHERVESYLIKHFGYTYDDAHDVANKIELVFREKTHGISDEEESERISSVMYAAFKKHFKPKGGKKYQMEGVADASAEKQFGIESPHRDFEDKFARDQEEDVVYKDTYSDLVIIRNPKRLESIFGYARGVIDPEGNLYIEQRPAGIHFDMLYALNKLGLVEDTEDWDSKLPTNFVTVQRYLRTNKILLGESNFAMKPDNERPTDSQVWRNVPSYEEAQPIYQRFLDKAKQKTPIFEFINERVDRYTRKIENGGGGDENNTIFEAENISMISEGDIMSLQDLPFKQEVEQLGGKIFSVGGAVRDEFLGKQSKDLDVLITGVPFEQLEQILGKYGRVDAVGKSFGVLKFKPKGATDDIDIAIPRTETATGEGGHQGFDVKSDHALPIEKDLERRDFTINAIAKDSEGNIVDPFNGQEDLKNKIIRIVNPQAFSDDPLRMLRAVQFASRFGFTIEPETMQMIKENAHRVKEIAPERILTEFDKIIKKGDKFTGAYLLKSTGLLREIFGKDAGLLMGKNIWENVRTMGEFIWLLSDNLVENPAEFYKNNLKGDIPTYKELKALETAFSADVTNPIMARSIAHNMYLFSPESLNSQIIPDELKTAAQELSQGKYPKTVNELAVNGNDLVGLGLQGKAIGDMQKSLLLKIYADKVRNNREDLLALAKQNGEVIKEEVKPTDKIEYGCLMLFLDVPIWSKITSIINPDDVYEEPGYGIETEPHTTILYGFHDEVTSEDCFNLFKENMPVKPFKIGIKGISFFTGNPKFDVVKFDVESPELTKLNEIMKALPHTSAFPDYHPHITIAYVKPGEGQKYVKPFEKNRMLNGNELVYTWKGHKGNDGDKLMLDGSVDESLADESLADKSAERMFNMPNQGAEQDVLARGEMQSQEEEPVAMVRDRNGRKTPIYENPKSLANFGPNSRGIIDQEGNIFVAQKDGFFNHGNIGRALGFIEGDTEAMYNYLTEYMLVNRIQNSNAFGLADSSYDFAADEYDYENIKIVNDFLRAAKKRNPQYDFYPEYYESIKGEPVALNEYAYPEIGQEKPTWNVNGQQVDINFFTDQYYQWNQGRYDTTTTKSVMEFLDNVYPDFLQDEQLKHDLYHKLVDNEVLDEEEVKKNVKYTAVVLDDKSRTALLKRLGNMIPEGWETITHHMTMNLGPIAKEYEKFLGMTIVMEATEFSMDDMVMAVGVVVDKYLTKNKKPHITIAVNRAQGGKPMMSNQLSMWVNLSEPLILTGKVTEVE